MRKVWKINAACLAALLFAVTGNSHAGNVEVKLPTNSAFQVISGVQPLMHVGSNGKVGIGTATITSPTNALTVYRAGLSAVEISSGNNKAFLGFFPGFAGSNYMSITASAGSDIERALEIFDETTLQARLTVRKNGDIGIGTTSPSYKLHVNGTAAGTSWTNLSSREFKENINVVGESEHPMMLAKLMDMDLTRYRYKKEYGGDNEAKIGFIAEEMPKEVLSKDGKGVDVYELLTFTIGAMKAQQKEIETQRQYNKALEDRLAALEKLLEGK